MSASEVFEIRLPDEAATIALGEDLALALNRGDLVTLSGDLGAGKSSLARALIRTIADDEFYEVPSPTFTLVQAYDELRLPIAHADLYRLSGGDELDELGFDEFLQDGAVLVEWPEQADGMLGTPAFAIELRHPANGEQGRIVTITAQTNAAKRFTRSRAIRAFLEEHKRLFNAQPAKRRYLLGDASPRAYETVSSDFGTEILMNAPELSGEPLLPNGKTYRKTAHIAESCIPFSAIDKLIEAQGFRVPEIYAEDLANGFILMEHLGVDGVLDENRQPIKTRYLEAARFLAHFHQVEWPLSVKVAGCDDYHFAPFDRDAMMIEVDLLCSWYLPRITGKQPDEAQKQSYHDAWDEVFLKLAMAEKSLLLRDYHSPNLFWFEEKSGINRIGMIDFQDAMNGPAAYDLASLALDARVTIAAELEQQIISAYCETRKSLDKAFDEAAFMSAYAIMGAQRNSKILGIFVRLDERDGKPHYLAHLPRIQDYLRRVLTHPDLKPVADWYEKYGLLTEKKP